jgi:hypothetical protein
VTREGYGLPQSRNRAAQKTHKPRHSPKKGADFWGEDWGRGFQKGAALGEAGAGASKGVQVLGGDRGGGALFLCFQGPDCESGTHAKGGEACAPPPFGSVA